MNTPNLSTAAQRRTAATPGERHNPFAPPKADLADRARDTITAPLWNPNAAANWCLLFSPAFGAYLHMKNWQALGQPDKARSARTWFILTLVLLVGLTYLGILSSSRLLVTLVRPAGFLLLVSWYFGSARGQARYVKSHLNDEYPRRGWARPLLVAVAALIGFIVLAGAVGGLAGYLHR